jgi:hypothetical protein
VLTSVALDYELINERVPGAYLHGGRYVCARGSGDFPDLAWS